jgi:hypothetical protein
LRRVITSISILAGFLVFASEIWFDFSTPLMVYIYGSALDMYGLGVGMGWKIFDSPRMEVVYIRLTSDSSSLNYIALKPLIFHGTLEKFTQNFSLFGDVAIGFDSVFTEEPLKDPSFYLTLSSGVGVEYSSVEKQGVLARIKMEVVIRMRITKSGIVDEISPYYIKLIGPLHIRPAALLGGKF